MVNQEPAPGLSPSASVEEIRTWLSRKENRLAVDWRCIWPDSSRLLNWGDNSHQGFSAKQAYIDSVPELKSVGLTHVGFEVLAQFFQDEIDEYSQLKSGDHRLPAAREKIWEHLNQQWEVPAETNWKYVEMLDASRDAGLKILCLEPNIKNAMGFERGEGFPLVAQGLSLLQAHHLGNLKDYASGKTCGARRQEIRDELLETLKENLQEGSKAGQLMDLVELMSSQGFDFTNIGLPGEDDQQTAFLLRIAEWRNRVWKQVIDRTLESAAESQVPLPSASNKASRRMLIFAGTGHFGHLEPYRTLNDELNEHSAAEYHPVTVCFTGGEYSEEEDREMRELVEQNKSKPWAEVVLWQNRLCDAMQDVPDLREGYFAFRVSNNGPNKPADYMIHLRQT